MGIQRDNVFQLQKTGVALPHKQRPYNKYPNPFRLPKDIEIDVETVMFAGDGSPLPNTSQIRVSVHQLIPSTRADEKYGFANTPDVKKLLFR